MVLASTEVPAYALLGVPENKDIRIQLLRWQAVNHWPWMHLANAMRAWGLSNIPGAVRLEAFSQSTRVSLHEDALRSLRRFLLTFPKPESYFDLVEQLDAKRTDRAREKQEQSQRELLQREEDRRQHISFWLKREAAPNGRPAIRDRPMSNPLFGLDKATINALSGGTL